MNVKANFNFNPNKLRVLEVFRSIQGEGLEIGKEAVFVRMSGCNLSCVWCDTKHSWAGNLGSDLTPKELLGGVINDAGGPKHVIITGGEPFLQPDMPLCDLVLHLKRLGFRVSWETNGTIWPTSQLAELSDFFSVSPKLASANQFHFAEYEINRWAEALGEKMQLKFVISDFNDMFEAMNLLAKSPAVANKKVPIIFQPEASVDKELYAQLPDMLREVGGKINASPLDYSIRFLPQVHKMYNIR